MKNLVLNYFSRTALVKNTNEAVNFINSLQYRNNGHFLQCSEHCKNILENYFSGKSVIYRELTTTGCSTTRIMVYEALANTLEEHNEIVKLKQQQEEKVQEEKNRIAHENWLNEMYKPLKGWYVVTLDILVSKIKGNDGKKTYSFKVLAENQMDAYNRTISMIEEKGVNDKNVSFIYHVADSAKSALIEFVGIWTDEAVLEFGN